MAQIYLIHAGHQKIWSREMRRRIEHALNVLDEKPDLAMTLLETVPDYIARALENSRLGLSENRLHNIIYHVLAQDLPQDTALNMAVRCTLAIVTTYTELRDES